jgi:hypothetical protein
VNDGRLVLRSERRVQRLQQVSSTHKALFFYAHKGAARISMSDALDFVRPSRPNMVPRRHTHEALSRSGAFQDPLTGRLFETPAHTANQRVCRARFAVPESVSTYLPSRATTALDGPTAPHQPVLAAARHPYGVYGTAASPAQAPPPARHPKPGASELQPARVPNTRRASCAGSLT